VDDLSGLSRPELLLLLQDLLQVNTEQQARIVRLEEEIARLRGGTPAPTAPRETPSFVKPNRKPKDASQPKRPRKQRPHGFARKREQPTRVVTHYPGCCSECGRKLSDGWLHSSRQVIDIPQAPIEVIEHRIMARHCGVCDRREVGRVDLSQQVLGKSRFGVRLMSLIGYLDTACRMPIETIQRLLAGLYQVQVSKGEIVGVLHTLARVGKGTYEGLLSEVRQSEVLHVDETGAREEGLNGYVWSLSTPSVRYYHRDPSRSASVIQILLGYDPAVFQARSARKVRLAAEAARARDPVQARHRFRGVLVSDFYNAYHWYGGWHQCCLVHLDRDLDQLRADNAEDPNVGEWVKNVLDLIERAKVCAREHASAPVAVRKKYREAFEREAEQLARPYCRSALPQRVLAERIRKHRGQLFVFVSHPDVPSDNNAAERAIRPFVVQRKVSGGTRSEAGSKTQAVLLSLFGTWLLRGQHALNSCQSMLAADVSTATS
jgi:transposase